MKEFTTFREFVDYLDDEIFYNSHSYVYSLFYKQYKFDTSYQGHYSDFLDLKLYDKDSLENIMDGLENDFDIDYTIEKVKYNNYKVVIKN
jgi:hypothetical protein